MRTFDCLRTEPAERPRSSACHFQLRDSFQRIGQERWRATGFVSPPLPSFIASIVPARYCIHEALPSAAKKDAAKRLDPFWIVVTLCGKSKCSPLYTYAFLQLVILSTLILISQSVISCILCKSVVLQAFCDPGRPMSFDNQQTIFIKSNVRHLA